MGASACASLLAELIRFDTINPGGDELALCAHLADLLRRLGADEVITGTVPRPGQQGGWVFARYGEPTLLINAHVDTVPPNRGWSRPPLEPEITGDRVIGLGSADTKGAIAAILTALQAVRPRNVGILFSGDEERTSTVVPAFVAQGLASAARHAVICEPTGRRAGTRHRGVLCFEADIRGAGGHSSRADSLLKPIAVLGRLAAFLGDLGERLRGIGPADMPGLCLNVASLDGGVAFNVVPESARLTWSMRPAPGVEVEAVIAEIAAKAAAIEPSINIRPIIELAPFQTRERSHFEALLDGAATELGPVDFWTEAAVFSAHGIDAVVIGPGDIQQAHAADEFVTLADLEWATALYCGVLARHDG